MHRLPCLRQDSRGTLEGSLSSIPIRTIDDLCKVMLKYINGVLEKLLYGELLDYGGARANSVPVENVHSRPTATVLETASHHSSRP